MQKPSQPIPVVKDISDAFVNMVLNIHRNHKAYLGGGDWGEGGMEVGEEGEYIYTYRYTVTTKMTPALRWAAMRAILMFH